MELDLAWAVKGGTDPVELFKKQPGRFPLWHVKDLDRERNVILPLGEGTIDFKPIFNAASVAGMKYIFIEHECLLIPLKVSIQVLKILSSYQFDKKQIFIAQQLAMKYLKSFIAFFPVIIVCLLCIALKPKQNHIYFADPLSDRVQIETASYQVLKVRIEIFQFLKEFHLQLLL